MSNASCFFLPKLKLCNFHLQERLGLAHSEEVEDWLVRAMGKKLLSGQMDQVKQQVTITKASQQTFDTEDWQLLQKQLAAWKVNTRG